MALSLQKIEKNLHHAVGVHLYDAIDSTNNEAKRRADTHAGLHLYATTHQTAGRGRHGHSFYSPKDTGLYMTLALPLSDAPADVQKLTCAAAVAVCGAITALSEVRPQIKWVNDIYVGGRKAAGILTELVTDSLNRPLCVIVGIGLNLSTVDFPAEIADTAGSIGDVSPELLCAGITDRLIEHCGKLNENSFIEEYKRLNLCIGRTVMYTKDGRQHTARAVDIAPDGGLVVEENETLTTLNSGEISVIPR